MAHIARDGNAWALELLKRTEQRAAEALGLHYYRETHPYCQLWIKYVIYYYSKPQAERDRRRIERWIVEEAARKQQERISRAKERKAARRKRVHLNRYKPSD